MKKSVSIVVVILMSLATYAQHQVVKLNVPSLAFGRLSLEAERTLIPFLSVTAGINVQLPSDKVSVPFLPEEATNTLERFDLRLTGTTYNAELRIYPNPIKERPRGLYIAPYYRTGNMKLDFPTFEIEYVPTGTTIPVTGVFDVDVKIQETGYGVQIGNQWLIADKISIDLFLTGPRYSTLIIDADLKASASVGDVTLDGQVIADKVALLFGKFGENLEPTIDDEGDLQLHKTMPFFGMRTGIKVGFAF